MTIAALPRFSGCVGTVDNENKSNRDRLPLNGRGVSQGGKVQSACSREGVTNQQFFGWIAS